MNRLLLLATTHRVPPGLLSWPAWDAVRSAARVCTADAGHPHRGYLDAAGVPVEVLDAADDRALAATLVDAARAGDVVFLAAQQGEERLGAELAAVLTRLSDRGEAPEVEVLHGSWDAPGARLLDLVAVMDRLRSPGGCPWDADQTHASLVQYLIEETYETVEAIEAGHLVDLREELGDLLLQVVFHARIGEEHAESPWSIDDVAAGVVEKLVRRHPHVFADAHAPSAEHVETSWHALKAAEKGRTSAVDGVPFGQPALLLAAKLMSRAERSGVAVPVGAIDPGADDVGELLLAVVALARRRHVDPESALRAAARRYADRVRAAEQGRS